MTRVADVPAFDNPFPAGELAARLDLVRSDMASRKLDAIVLTEPADIYYLTGYDTQGFWSYQALVVPVAGPPTIVCFVEEAGHAESRGLRWSGYAFGDDPVRTTARTLAGAGLGRGRLGLDLESRFLSVSAYRGLADALPDATLVGVGDLVERRRLVKSKRELAYIREASTISNEVMRCALDSLTIGVSDRAIASVLTAGSIERGSDYFSMGPYVKFGPSMVEGHLTWQGRVLAQGDAVELEVAAVRRRYNAPILRFAVAGPIAGALAEAAEVSRAGMEVLRAAVVPGRTGRDIWREVYALAAGRDVTYLPGGYSVGIGYPPDWTEADVIASGSEFVLEPGMVFHMVSFCLLAEARFGTSDVVVVTEDGCETLNTLEPGPIEI